MEIPTATDRLRGRQAKSCVEGNKLQEKETQW